MAQERFADIDELHKFLMNSAPTVDKENIRYTDDIAVVNVLLEGIGLDGSLKSLSEVSVEESFNQTVKTMKRALLSLKSNEERLQKGKSKLEAMIYERDSMRNSVQQEKKRLRSLENKLIDTENRMRHYQEDVKKTTKALKQELNELKSFSQGVLHRESQVRLEMKKKECEHDKIRERLRVLTSRNEGSDRSKAGSRYSRSVRKLPSDDVKEADLRFHNFMQSFRERQEIRISDNERLKEELVAVDASLIDLLKSGEFHDVESVEPLLTLPFSIVSNDVSASMLRKLEMVKESAGVQQTGEKREVNRLTEDSRGKGEMSHERFESLNTDVDSSGQRRTVSRSNGDDISYTSADEEISPIDSKVRAIDFDDVSS